MLYTHIKHNAKHKEGLQIGKQTHTAVLSWTNWIKGNTEKQKK